MNENLIDEVSMLDETRPEKYACIETIRTDENVARQMLDKLRRFICILWSLLNQAHGI